MGERTENLARAARELETAGLAVRRCSSVYETEPVGLRAQPWFLNQVVEAETKLFPMQLLDRVQAIETQLGRRRLVPQGPRTIDIDILLYGNFRIQSDRLVVPHPRIAERRFVLEPLSELAPALRHPTSRLSIHELLAATPDRSTVRRLNHQINKSTNHQIPP